MPAQRGASEPNDQSVSLLRSHQDPSTLWATRMPSPKNFCWAKAWFQGILPISWFSNLGFSSVLKTTVYHCFTWILQTYHFNSLYKPNPNKSKRVQKKCIHTCALLPLRNLRKHLNARTGYYRKHNPAFSPMLMCLWMTNAYPLISPLKCGSARLSHTQLLRVIIIF